MTPQDARKPWAEAVATVFTTLALGPPIGGLVFALCVAFYPAMAVLAGDVAVHGDATPLLMLMFLVGLFAVPFSFFFGGAQAIAAGLAFAAYGWNLGRPPLWFAGVTGLFAYAGARAAGFSQEGQWFIPFLLVHLIPAFACWAIVRLFWRPLPT